MPGKNKTSSKLVRAATNRPIILKMRLEGHSLDDIAAHLGLARSTVHQSITTSLNKLHEEASSSAEQVRALEDARLDGMLKAIQPKVDQGDPRAIDTTLRIQARRAALWGLDLTKPMDSFAKAVTELLSADNDGTET